MLPVVDVAATLGDGNHPRIMNDRPSPRPAPLVRCSGVRRTYGSGRGRTVGLADLDLEIEPGERVAVVGPSGSGKSTLLHLLGAMDRADEGTVEVAGRDLATLDDRAASRYRREGVGFVFQFFHLVPTLSALDNVALPLRLAGLPSNDARARALELLEKVGLGSRTDARPDGLSGGQQQRVALARALVASPPLLLADEPTGALDRSTGEEVLDLLVSLGSEHGTTLLIATHDDAVVDRATRIVRIEDGRLAHDPREPR